MANEHDTILIQALTDSYRRQLHYYLDLRDLVRQLMGNLVLSRRGLSGISERFREKQIIIEAIEKERDRIAEQAKEWHLRKDSVEKGAATERLDAVLQQVTDTIQEFLDDEAQLRKYLEGVVTLAHRPY